MFGVAAIVLFTIAAVLSGTATHVSSAWWQPGTLGYLGLACLAVQLLWPIRPWVNPPRR